MSPELHQPVAARLRTELYAGLLLMLITGCPANSGIARSPATSTTNRNTKPLPIQATIDLGVLYQGESAQSNRWITNQSDKPITIGKVQTSCECVNLQFDHQAIEAGEKALAHISYDGTKEPDFIGSLQVQITLTDSQDQTVGIVLVPVEVIPRK